MLARAKNYNKWSYKLNLYISNSYRIVYVSRHKRTGDRDIHVEENEDYNIIEPDPMTMLGTHKLLNSIIVIAYCSAYAL